MNPPKLFIFDSTNLFYRSFHGNERLTGPGGFPTGGIYGFVNSLQSIVQQYPDFQPVLVFDPLPNGAIPPQALENGGKLISTIPDLSTTGTKTRRELYPEYKATRSPMPPELQKQAYPLLLILHAMGYPIIGGNSVVEADDVIGTLAIETVRRGGEAIIGTTDKDVAAVVSERCSIYNFNMKALLNVAGVEEKYGVSPEKIAGYLALMGDTSDNIPGVVKCGDKTAAKWMNKYGTLDNVIAHASEISGVVGDNLRKALSILPLSYELTLLRTDIPLDFEACTEMRETNEHLLRHMYQGLGFQKFLHQLDTQARTKAVTTPTTEQASLELS